MTTAKIKVNKTVYNVIGISKDAEGMKGYTTYSLQKKNTIKTLVHNRKINDFTLWGGSGIYSTTMTTPNHIELIN